jgi:serine/threonine-protein kinase HipA
VAAPDQSCYVHIQLPGTFGWTPCARLQVRDLGGGAFEGTFTYGRQYLQRANVVALDPFHLPLTERPQKFTKLKGIPGAIRDASPDAWGRRVIQAKLQRPEADIAETDYLLNGPDDGAGNLRFGVSATPPATRRGFNRTHQLQALIDAAHVLEADGRLPHEVLEELEPGTSMGGARPKVTVEDDRRIWLAKLPEREDRHNLQRIEFATLELAREAGLHVCRTRLERVGGLDVLMLERFDRHWVQDANAYARHGLVSGLTVIDAEDGYFGRDRWSYLLLADELRRWSSHGDDDRRELFRRMVFNAMVTNTDDHPRNHALLNDGAGWRLSPAYDIVPMALVSQERRDLALTAGTHGRAASLYNLLSRCDVFGMAPAEARAEVDTMLAVVGRWRERFAAHGIGERTLLMLEGAMLPASFHLTVPPEPV